MISKHNCTNLQHMKNHLAWSYRRFIEDSRVLRASIKTQRKLQFIEQVSLRASIKLTRRFNRKLQFWEQESKQTNFNAYLITWNSSRFRPAYGSRFPHCIHRRHCQHICHTSTTPQIRSAQTKSTTISKHCHTTKERTRGHQHKTHTKESTKKIKETNQERRRRE